MSSPYVGEIRLFAGNFAPVGWALCQGQLLPIVENETLFNLIGTTYGGDGQSTFALPDLAGRIPVHAGQGHVIGEKGGAESVTLTSSQIPQHTHAMLASTTAAIGTSPAGALLATTNVASYDTAPAATPMAAVGIGMAGGSQPHDNMAPTVAVNYIISLFGIFPSQS
ncbi:phage tail protein [Roseateles saccharophilus]|uniref:Microcystin-dependent protein n=1 Tax=Roseateles saccharophilus TaxID=304 RepID=A0A4R3UYH4_ROSSA|nr:tail fiber protein [Roseateles saccharophilus]MDG0835336.1 phage tail protein [Roseateles saccharophilus]TCU96141.1 microcystin-dependent protein [Roseateles saccharophilus]